MGGGESEDRQLCDRVYQASRVQLGAIQVVRRRKNANGGNTPEFSPAAAAGSANVTVVVCGTGGFPSLLRLIFSVPDPARMPLTVVGLSMPKRAVEALVYNLRKDTPIPVGEITEAGPLEPSGCYFMSIESSYRLAEGENRVQVEPNGFEPHRNHFFDDLLSSAAEAFGPRASAVLISGTGEDGIEGMWRVWSAGGLGLALSPEACIRPDLSRKVIKLGYADEIKTIGDLAGWFDSEALCAKRNMPGDHTSGLDSI
jgi:chemotaxis response regulator CheB